MKLEIHVYVSVMSKSKSEWLKAVILDRIQRMNPGIIHY